MLEFKAYMTYLAYATGEKTPKPKSTKKKADSESSPKIKLTQASKGKRVKTLAKGGKPAKKKQSATKSKGLMVLSEAALTEAEHMKIALEEPRYKLTALMPVAQVMELTYSQSENDNDDEDDDQENVHGETQSDDDGDNFVHPNLSTYKVDDQEKEKEEEKENDDDEVSSNQMVSTPLDYEISDEEENQEDDDNVMGGKQENKEDEELYGDLNLNLDRRDAEISSVLSDLVSKFINPSPDIGIDLILNPNVQSDIPVNVSVFATTNTPSSDTTIPQPPIPIIQSQQQTHNSTTTTTTIPTITFLEIPNFASLFGFKLRVSLLETELFELKQTNQFAEALSSIRGIVDKYLASQIKDAVNVAVQLKSNKLKEED
ncbi:hypothetical protein Tco_0364173 [Tanacetum coccineum]